MDFILEGNTLYIKGDGEITFADTVKYAKNDAIKRVVLEGNIYCNNCAMLFSDYLAEEFLGFLDTSNCEIFSFMYAECINMVKDLDINTDNGLMFEGMYSDCHRIKSYGFTTTVNGKRFDNMFYQNKELVDPNCISGLIVAKAVNTEQMFENCYNLKYTLKQQMSSNMNYREMYKDCPEVDENQFIYKYHKDANTSGMYSINM